MPYRAVGPTAANDLYHAGMTPANHLVHGTGVKGLRPAARCARLSTCRDKETVLRRYLPHLTQVNQLYWSHRQDLPDHEPERRSSRARNPGCINRRTLTLVVLTCANAVPFLARNFGNCQAFLAPATLGQFNIPEAGLLLIMGVDHCLDMGRTATNVLGNAVASAAVAKWEGVLAPSSTEGIPDDDAGRHHGDGFRSEDEAAVAKV
ncbi:Sodium:dicarboxylate symporter family protein [Burkholderia sp. YR290]|nr:Sodium:dicarboxylate symporter family protein [Burkholderia sp. YR290]